MQPGPGTAAPDTGPVVAAARRVSDELLAPQAEAVDIAGAVPSGHLAALADAGLMGILGPASHGGLGLGRRGSRQVFEILAGACGSTFFVWVQHHAPVRLLADSPNRDLVEHYLPALCSGRLLGAVAFAHLRRPGSPAVVARGLPGGGWHFCGHAPWLTSWGLADVVAVAGATGDGDDDTVVFALMPAQDGSGMAASAPMSLAAMGASRTVSVEIDRDVGAVEVICEMPLGRWRSLDRAVTAAPNPATFGLAATCVRLLTDVAPAAAETLGEELVELRSAAYAMSDGGSPPAELVVVRAAAGDLALRCSAALVAATGGRAMALAAPAQRLAREALFYLIQAQTAPVRQAALNLLTARAPGRSRCSPRP